MVLTVVPCSYPKGKRKEKEVQGREGRRWGGIDGNLMQRKELGENRIERRIQREKPKAGDEQIKDLAGVEFDRSGP